MKDKKKINELTINYLESRKLLRKVQIAKGITPAYVKNTLINYLKVLRLFNECEINLGQIIEKILSLNKRQLTENEIFTEIDKLQNIDNQQVTNISYWVENGFLYVVKKYPNLGMFFSDDNNNDDDEENEERE